MIQEAYNMKQRYKVQVRDMIYHTEVEDLSKLFNFDKITTFEVLEDNSKIEV